MSGPAGPGLQAWQRGATAAVLGSGYLVARRRTSGHGAPTGRARAAVGALAAAGGPALLFRHRLGADDDARWRPPPSAAGRLLLGAYVTAGALLEEALWRGPLVLRTKRTGSPRCAAWRAALSAAGFLALHLRRDGARSLPVHLTTTASWTLSALLGRQLRWPVLAHAGYNFAAASLRSAGARAS